MLKRFENKPLFWLFPIVVFLLLFYLWPMLEVFRLSLTNSTLLRTGTQYSLRNYRYIFSSQDFYFILKITFTFVLGSLIGQVLLGLAIALLVHRGIRRGIIGAEFTRATVLSSWIIPSMAIGLIWKILLTDFDYGILNYIIDSIFGSKIPFLSSPKYAMLSVIIANVWCGTAFSMLILFSGLQRIPDDFYEAAIVDGASSFQQFRYITIPHLSTFIFIDLALATIYTFNSFGLIMTLTAGGPGLSTEVLALHVYTTIFENLHLGRGSALAIVLLIINLVIAIIHYRLFGKDDMVAQ